MMSRLSLVALLWSTPLFAGAISGKAALENLGYTLDRDGILISKAGETEDSEHFEVTLPNKTSVHVSFEFSAEPDTTLFEYTSNGATVNDGIKVVFLFEVGQAFCAQRRTLPTECLVFTESFFRLMFDPNTELNMFPYIHFASDELDVEDLVALVTDLRRATE